MRNNFRIATLATLMSVTTGLALAQEPASGDPSSPRSNDAGASVKPAKKAPGAGTRENQSKDLQQAAETAEERGSKGAAKSSEAKSNHGEPGPDEEAGITPYYNNFFDSYRLGPEDVISISVFGQDRYSKSGIVVPPNGRISYPLISEGILVAGKTVEEIAAFLTKRYDEFIIDPKITVSLDKAVSYRYSVVGDVAQPGIKPMGRRLTVTEALAEAGGVLPTGNTKKIVVLRRGPAGSLDPIPVDVSAIYKHRAPDVVFLKSGDQIIVPGNRMKQMDKILRLLPILSFARIFTGTGY